MATPQDFWQVPVDGHGQLSWHPLLEETRRWYFFGQTDPRDLLSFLEKDAPQIDLDVTSKASTVKNLTPGLADCYSVPFGMCMKLYECMNCGFVMYCPIPILTEEFRHHTHRTHKLAALLLDIL